MVGDDAGLRRRARRRVPRRRAGPACGDAGRGRAGSTADLVRPAHTLKGTSLNLGAAALRRVAERSRRRRAGGSTASSVIDGRSAFAAAARPRRHAPTAGSPVSAEVSSPTIGAAIRAGAGPRPRRRGQPDQPDGPGPRRSSCAATSSHEAEDGLEALERLREDAVRRRPARHRHAAHGRLRDPRARSRRTLGSAICRSSSSPSVEDVDSVVRCIEMGALDHLPKPFEPAILHARLACRAPGASPARAGARSTSRSVGRVTAAAEALEGDAYRPGGARGGGRARPTPSGRSRARSSAWPRRSDAREEALRAEVRELRIEIDEALQSRTVAEITDTEYFRDLRGRAGDLRRILRDQPPIRRAGRACWLGRRDRHGRAADVHAAVSEPADDLRDRGGARRRGCARSATRPCHPGRTGTARLGEDGPGVDVRR